MERSGITSRRDALAPRRRVAEVVSRHAEDAAMLWLLRRGGACAPHFSLPDLARLDGRLEAHLDGLRVAGEDAEWKELLSADVGEGEVFVLASSLFESGRPGWPEELLGLLDQDPSGSDAIVSALGWLPHEHVVGRIRALLEAESPIHQELGLAASAVHRWHPGPALSRLLASSHPVVRARALKVVGELGDKQDVQDLLYSLRDPDPGSMFAAAWSGARLGLPVCVEVLLSVAATSPGYRLDAADLALRRTELSAALEWHAEISKDPYLSRLAIRTAGIIGDPALIPWVMTRMVEQQLSRVAGEAFTTITGADLAYRDLECKPPEDYNAGPTEDPADDNVEMDPDENLPWPDPVLVQHWWDANRSRFKNGTRYLLGNPITDDWLKIVLRDGRQRQRAAAALEIALRNPGQPLFNVKAPGFRQQKLLGKGEVIR